MPAQNDAFMAGVLVGGACAGLVCGFAPLGVALQRGRVVTGFVCLALCVGAGVLGGLCLGIPTACVLVGLVKLLGHAEPTVRWDGPPARRAARRDRDPDRDHRPAEPYTRIGSSVVCNSCRTAAAGPGGRPPAACPGCGVPFRAPDADPPVVYPARRDDDIIDLEPAGR